MYLPELTQLAGAGSGLTVVSHTMLSHSFSLKPPAVLLVLHQQTQRSYFSLFCPLIGLYSRVSSQPVLISTSVLLLVVSPGDQKPKQVQRTTRYDAKRAHNVDQSVKACVQQRGPALKQHSWDLVWMSVMSRCCFFLYTSMSRESKICSVGFTSYIYSNSVCFFLGSCSVRGRLATGEQRTQRQGGAHCNMHTHPPTLTHSHVSWCFNEHPYFSPLRLQCNVQFNGLMFRNGYFMCPGLLCIYQPEAHLIRQLSLIPH